MQRILGRTWHSHTRCNQGLGASVLRKQPVSWFHDSTTRCSKEPSQLPVIPEKLLARLFPEKYTSEKEKKERELRLEQLKQSVRLERPRRNGTHESETAISAGASISGSNVQVSKGLLRMEMASKNLIAEDFHRLMPHDPQAGRLKLQQGAIEKVIPGRDLETLEQKDYYYLVFASIKSARTYRERAARLAKLFGIYGPFAHISDRPVPEELVLPGENPYQLAQSYSLTPHGQNLSMRLLEAPYSPNALSMLENHGYAAIVKRPGRAVAEVAVRTQFSVLAYTPLLEAIKAAEVTRNLPWTGGKFGGFKLSKWELDPESRPVRARKPLKLGNAFNVVEPSELARTMIVGLDSTADAEIFARYWHRRALQSQAYRKLAPPVILDAELLW